MRLRSTTRVSFVLIALVPWPACSLDRSISPPPTLSVSVVPAFICAGEEVAVTWDAGEQTDSRHCRPGLVPGGFLDEPSRDECIFVDRSSSPLVAAWDGTDDHETQGSVAVSVTETTTFDAHATVESYEGSGESFARDASATARVIEETEPPGPTALPFTFEGDCAGALATWKRVDLKDETSGCLEVLEVCSTGAESIELADVDSDSGRRASLSPDDACTDVFNGRGPNLTGRIDGYVTPPGLCGEEMTTGGPPSFGIRVLLQCNRDLPTCAF